ncbi:MAG: 23S rRNA (uracil1939-C5)-methyltransferase [Parasphingorhabdus sp.]|jgi:23S rRNA (uracil1939-C5)-methyltransferase
MPQLEGVVQGLSHDGRGVVRVEGKVYFVEGALPGEKISFTRMKRQKKHEIGFLDKILQPSLDRVEPPCKYFGTCGGCVLQHLSPTAQLKFKQQTLIENLQRIGNVTSELVLKPVTGPVTGYRRKARLGISYIPKKGGVMIGFREKQKPYIVSLDQCVAMDQGLSRLLPSLHELVSKLSFIQRLPQIEVTRGDESIAIIFRHLDPLVASDYKYLKEYEAEQQVVIYLQSGGSDTVKRLSVEEIAPLFYRLPEQEISIEFEPTDFLQINGLTNQKLIQAAIDQLQPTEDDSVLELFCGLGNFSLPIARRVKQVVAVESNQDLVKRAEMNARNNGLSNMTFNVGDLYQDSIVELAKLGKFNKLFLDPPRNGAIEVVRNLVPLIKPEKIVYVSCNPSTLARDSEILCRVHGYTLQATGIVDMFPHTAHVESIAVFQLR